MKARKLQFGKALSAALFVLLLVVAGTKNALAQTQVATLQHGDDISVFYGSNAFVEAHTAAADGDIVTLSGGSFSSTTITKAITLRGAGVVSDTVAQTNPTIFAGDVTFNVANDSVPLNVEGIMFNGNAYYRKLTNPKFTRCNFNNYSYYISNDATMSGAQFVNCMVKTFDNYRANNTTFINSVVWESKNMNASHTVLLYNSIFGNAYNSYSEFIVGVSAFSSVIIKTSSSTSYSYQYGLNNTFINCIGIKMGSNVPFGGYTAGCVTYTSYADVFESFTGTFSFDEAFVLKDSIATGFLGSDGTQVGIHGGFMPYSNRPSYMVLRRCNVANRSTVDGKLSVEIEVVTEE